MKFHINHIPSKPGYSIEHSHLLMLIGSCFSDNIGQKLKALRFKCEVNPTGILYNPSAILNSLDNAVRGNKNTPDRIIEREGFFYSFDHHSSFSANSPEELTALINKTDKEFTESLKKTDYLFITFGSAFVYRLKSSAQIVANCHKQPSTAFEKSLLEVEEIVSTYLLLIEELKKFNPRIKIIFTVSPVKHLRDGVVENNVSKATLLLAVNKLVKHCRDCFYFPSYELVTDDLRDYRFFKEDLAHPNDLAIQYVFDKFSDCFFNAATRELNKHINDLNVAMQHRPIGDKHLEDKKHSEYIAKKKEMILLMDNAIDLE